MQKHILGYLSLCTLLSSAVLLADRVVTPKFTIRSQSFNAARRLAGHEGHINLYDQEEWYADSSLTPEYTRSIQPYKISECLFGDLLNDNNAIKIQGSRVFNRDTNALLADYFYLPTDFKSTVCFTPRIQNVLVDLNYYMGLNTWLPGLYYRVQAPLTWTKWALNMRETINDNGENGYDAGYFTGDELVRDILLDSFTDFMAGKSPGRITQFLITNTQEIIVDMQPLKYAKVKKSDRKTAISEIRSAFGYNFLLEEDYHFGANIQVAAPTGNRPKARYLFAAQNGNGHHWELGAGIDGHYTFWRSEDEEKSLSIHMSLDVLHLTKTRQKRTFDLCGKPLSRYMIAEKMTSVIDYNLTGDGAANYPVPNAQFKQIFAPVANITTLDVDVSVNAQADLVALLNYTNGNISLDLGYEFFGRSCEKLDLHCCPEFEEKTWALKGDAQVFGYDINNNLVQGAVPLSATNNNANIHGGGNFGTAGVTDADAIQTAKTNPNIDYPQDAFGDSQDLGAHRGLGINNNNDVHNPSNPQINTSIDPVFITQDDINFVRTRSISHKLFGHFQYNWDDRKFCKPLLEKDYWAPYLGFGFEVEFAPGQSCCVDNSGCCDKNECIECTREVKGDCIRCGLSQWGAWLKVGVSIR